MDNSGDGSDSPIRGALVGVAAHAAARAVDAALQAVSAIATSYLGAYSPATAELVAWGMVQVAEHVNSKVAEKGDSLVQAAATSGSKASCREAGGTEGSPSLPDSSLPASAAELWAKPGDLVDSVKSIVLTTLKNLASRMGGITGTR